ncbi:hypothetical protein AXF42_Ash000279 [Apostasia shenzhenica]|uniref:Uncharacterized protein n=1 Tax=Apostasia shenzhenica TaxID=1088818 RepID=A0A2I0AG29_9ASPA|nr:hypothetical protein AXF42_Ash000279 [Apostasia shenzhenica]
MAQPTSSGVKSFIWTQLIYRFGLPLPWFATTGPPSQAFPFEKTAPRIASVFISFSSSPSVERSSRSDQQELSQGAKEEARRSQILMGRRAASHHLGTQLLLTTATGQTPYSLVFDGKALIPVELEIYSPQVENASNFEPQLPEWHHENDNSRRLELDLLKERRELVALRQAEHRRRVMRNYNKHVRRRPLEEGNLVLKLRTTAGRDIMPPGKLDSNWEGPFIIRNVLRPSTNKLVRQDGTHSENVERQ